MLKNTQKNNYLNNFKDNEIRNYISTNNKPYFENNFNNNILKCLYILFYQL